MPFVFQQNDWDEELDDAGATGSSGSCSGPQEVSMIWQLLTSLKVVLWLSLFLLILLRFVPGILRLSLLLLLLVLQLSHDEENRKTEREREREKEKEKEKRKSERRNCPESVWKCKELLQNAWSHFLLTIPSFGDVLCKDWCFFLLRMYFLEISSRHWVSWLPRLISDLFSLWVDIFEFLYDYFRCFDQFIAWFYFMVSIILSEFEEHLFFQGVIIFLFFDLAKFFIVSPNFVFLFVSWV